MEQATNSSELPFMLTDLMFGTRQTVFQWSIPFKCPVVLEISLVRLGCPLSPSHLLLFLSTSPFSLSVSLPCYRLPSSPSLSLVCHSSGAVKVLQSFMSPPLPVQNLSSCLCLTLSLSPALWPKLFVLTPAPCPSPVLFLSVVLPGVGLFEWGEPGVTGSPHCRCQLPLCFKHKHLKHFSCAATRQCMQLKTIGPICICIPFLRGNVRWNSMIL